MRIKDILKFLACAAVFLIGLWFLSRNMTPDAPPEKKRDKASENAVARPTRETAAAGFAAHYAREQFDQDNRDQKTRDNWKKSAADRKDQLGAAAGSAWAAAGRAWPAVAAAATHKTITLGNDGPECDSLIKLLKSPDSEVRHEAAKKLRELGKDGNSEFHLQVTFDQRGAAVRRVVLNKFKSSDRLGHPVNEPLELIPYQEDLPDYIFGSNVLFHFDVEKPSSKRPLDTLGKIDWRVVEYKNGADDEEHFIKFAAAVQGGVEVTKTFRLPRRAYHIGLEVGMRRTEKTAGELKFRYQLTGVLGLPVEGSWYTSTFRHALIGMMDLKASDEDRSPWRDYQDNREIAKKLGGDEVKRDEKRRFLYAGVAVQFFASVIAIDNDQQHQRFLAAARPTLESRVVILEPEKTLTPADRELILPERKDRKEPETLTLSDEALNQLLTRGAKKGDRIPVLVVSDSQDKQIVVRVLSEWEARPEYQDDITVRVMTEEVDLPVSEKVEVVHKYLLYNGPVKPMLLGQMTGDQAVADGLVDRYVHDLHLNTLTDYHSPGIGNFANKIYLTDLIILFTNLCHRILNFLHMLIPSYGICIILLTVMVRGIMFPLSRKQALTSMKMQSLQPELKKLKEKFGDDRHGFAMAQMALFKKHNISMFGSCWMIMLQMPIFMGLYYCLQESVHFRLAGFLWIDNLAAPDMLVWWSESIPLLSRPSDIGSILYLGPYLNILPIVAVTLMIFQQKKMMPPPADEQAAMQQKMMKYMMIFFGLMFYKVAAGLCVYFIASSVWGFTERKLLPKLKPIKPGESADSLFQKVVGTSEPGPVESKMESNGLTANNRAKRRQERKRKQERASTRAVTDTPAPPEEREDAGWWSNMRRKVGGWWKDVLKKASKKWRPARLVFS